ncbi:MAG: 50S ribosomal protein L2 [Candidatus Komeilibacteria bacterium CG11_big_fil_rev_8_21_14_0_20_36_20]|uniref:Large ribosomal subunit protein uL2 n=1 Tax=Candidatus Komeilibacteria bacterium CG11_big_fil_rev_8_21_14_0_20_36_20 TaxID=1974477 RepID=A0A2H0NDR4_9BACT|nr:MAG: 50S ribosomal protein L2 [Candidatus Komeilibacteria bacterium CG11_big_fil_rev_8_21_14_0_20_36_20]PIR81403.1 MAG: 50S ribosomal protein L2 [Candidatus Komeilibacteria bacterium CG10_big_fil_rev_8_21_14_0_10_36_65]PJC55128.1 MAG: 50S ribosomal protein L2 [Candidatus Komeilibacteria bacterium CG_4_9_14_0_2_um_filter_36_13]
MPVKVYKPTTPARRQTSVVVNKNLSKKRPVKSLVVIKKKKAGRNNKGRITVRHQGGGAKRFIRLIDFKRDKFDIAAKVESLEYDPNRNTNIALVLYADGERQYILAPERLKVGDKIMSSQKKISIKIGNCLCLKNIPTGTTVYNVEMSPGKGGQLARSAGSGLVLMALDNGQAQLKMPSGEIRAVPDQCLATIGLPSNIEFRNIRWGKAGRKRHLGIRPTVRGKVMNPVDHPHGGGEGSNPIGMKHPKTYKGKPAYGVKTRRKNKASNKFIIKSRKKSRK